MKRTVNWSGSVALITGAGSGIGRALAHALAQRGAELYLSDVRGDAVERVAREIGERARATALDVRDAAGVRSWVERAARERGRIDYLFNNAGIGIGGLVQELSLKHWERALDVDLRGVIHGVHAAYPIMVEQRHGHIVNTASTAGLIPAPLIVPYATAKHAVVGLSTSLRMEAREFGVRVSVLCPGVIETPILDSDNPTDLPDVKWHFDGRRYVTNVAGPSYPADELATRTLEAVARNEAVIVIPARARAMWRMYRLAPNVLERVALTKLVAERRAPPKR